MSEEQHKLCILGTGAVGKSCITMQFVKDEFIDKWDPTIEDAYTRITEVDGKVVTLHVLDTAGQDEFIALRDQYMRDNHGFVLVYAINDSNSFSEVQDMYEQLRKAKDSDSVPVVLVGNKCDLPAEERVIAKNEGEKLASSWGNAKFFEASAKNRVNIVESFAQLVRLIRSETEEVPELDVKQTGATTKVPKQKKGLFSSSTSDADKKSDLIV